MACSITITNVEGITNPMGILDTVVVEGSSSKCKNVKIEVNCLNTNNQSTNSTNVNPDGTWTVKVPIRCECNEKVEVIARCSGIDGCEDKFSGILKCKPGVSCPEVVVTVISDEDTDDDVSIDRCNEDGTRTRVFDVDITLPAGIVSVISYMGFGDGNFSPPNSSLNYTLSHNYTPPGPFTASLIIFDPQGCPITTIIIEIPPCPCAELSVVEVNSEGCAGAGQTAEVTLTAVMTQQAENCNFTWDFGDNTPDQNSNSPTITHSYSTPGTFSGAVTAICGSCISVEPFTVEVTACCPIIEEIIHATEGCVDDDHIATVTFIANTNPANAAGSYAWNFGDGNTLNTTTPTATHPYNTAGSKTVSLVLTPTDTNCNSSTLTTDIEVPSCGDIKVPPPDEGGGCKGLRWAIVILSILALISVYIAICVPGAAPAFFYVAAGLAAGAVILGIIWGIFCPKPCNWGLLLSWQVALGAGIGALYFASCCTPLLAIGIGLILAGLATMAIWRSKCKISYCQLIAELAIVLAAAIVPVLGWLDAIPIIQPCLSPVVSAAVGTISAIVVGLLANCVSNK